MSDTNLSPDELNKIKQSFVKNHGIIRWEATREKESKNTSSRLSDHDRKLKWHDRKIDFAFYMMIGVVIVVVLGFLQLLASYYQMTQDVYNRFDVTIKNYSDEKYKKLENRIYTLESLTPTPIKITPTGQ